MSKTSKIFIIALIVFSILILTSLESMQFTNSAPKVIDLSNITLPSYKLPPNAKVTKEKIRDNLIKEIKMCREWNIPWDPHFPDGTVPTRAQVITIPYGEYTRIFFENKDASAATPKDKLYILVGIDIAEPLKQLAFNMVSIPPTQLRLWERTGALDSNRPVVNQELFLIDPMTGIVVEHGFYQGIFIFPKQD